MNNPNNSGYYNYNGWYNANFNPEVFMRKQNESNMLKKVGFYTGLAVIGNIVVQNFFVTLISLTPLKDKYLSDGVFASGFDILLSVLSLLVPFLLVGKKLKVNSGTGRIFYLGAPYRKNLMLPGVVAGIGCCMAANIATSFISTFFHMSGYEASSIEFNFPEGISGFILSFFRIAIVAGIVEEIAMRGYTLGSLRYFGDGFAILASSLVFAVIHGNFDQIPFALLSALGLGYFSVKTGTMWTGVLIHVFNNAISVIFYYLEGIIPENTLLVLQMLVIYGLSAIGVFMLVYFNNKTRDIPLMQGQSILSSKEKFKAYFSNAPMIVAFIYFIIVSLFAITAIE